MSSDCIFCAIVSGASPADIVYRDAHIVAFRDLHPKAPVHLLLVPTRHLGSLAVTSKDDQDLLGQLLSTARDLAHKFGIEQSGYRIILNTGADGGQLVPHLHLHLLGGRPLGPKLVTV